MRRAALGGRGAVDYWGASSLTGGSGELPVGMADSVVVVGFSDVLRVTSPRSFGACDGLSRVIPVTIEFSAFAIDNHSR